MRQPQEPTSGRLHFIDLVRSITVLMMVQGHTLHVLLHPGYKDNAIFDAWLFARGLTAPTFFLLAGFSFAFVTARRWSETTKTRARVLRFLSLIAMGYALHFPVRKVWDLDRIGAARWDTFFAVDVLQLVGVVLLLLQLLVLVCRSSRRFGLLSGAIGLVVFALTPAMRSTPWPDLLWRPVAAYLGADTSSLFPLFGWSGFIFIGAGLGTAFAVVHGRWSCGKLLAWAAALAALCLLLAMGLRHGLASVYPSTLAHEAKVEFLLDRLVPVVLELGIFCWLCRSARSMPSPLRALSEESLTVYFVHLCLLYGSIWSDGIWHWIGPRLRLLPTIGWIAVMLAGSVAVAWSWNAFKRRYPRGKQLARAAIVFALALPLVWPR
jgi:uncharacterized membrane protein